MARNLSRRSLGVGLGAAGLLSFSAAARAEDRLKVAVGQRGNWDTAVPELGRAAGIFAKHGLDLELLYTQGGGETQQAVLSGSVDIGIAVGTLGVVGAFSKGAPVRIISAEATGTAEYWYVRADSKIQSMKDADASTTIGYSTNGSSSHAVVLGFVELFNLKSRLIPTGSAPGTLTSVMSGQVDVGWSSPPLGFEALDKGEIRVIGRANDVPAIRNQTIRVNVTNARFLETRRAVVERFMAAYRETLDWMYSDDAALRSYSSLLGPSLADARRVRDEYFPKPLSQPDEVVGLDLVMADAMKFKVLTKPLGADQLRGLVAIPPRRA